MPTTLLTSVLLSVRLWAVVLLLIEVCLLVFARLKKERQSTKVPSERRASLTIDGVVSGHYQPTPTDAPNPLVERMGA